MEHILFMVSRVQVDKVLKLASAYIYMRPFFSSTPTCSFSFFFSHIFSFMASNQNMAAAQQQAQALTFQLVQPPTSSVSSPATPQSQTTSSQRERRASRDRASSAQSSCMGVISSFAIIQETPKKTTSKPKLHNTMATSIDAHLGDEQQHQQQQPQQNQRPKASELRFKIESVGTHLEEDDDLDTCPARTRAAWPREITPWWTPTHRYEKPPYSYATLIAHAILSSKDGRLTLSDIYKWISEHYPYYVPGQHGWQVTCIIIPHFLFCIFVLIYTLS